MHILIQDLLQLKSFNSIEFIAGKNGSHNEVTGVGLLDYELDMEFHDRYVYENLYEGLLCLTTFLYAKEQEYLMLEAIKILHNRNCSGLIIKNIYNMPISAKVLRYADSINFPLFLIKGNSVVFEDIILEVNSFSSIKAHTEKTEGIFTRFLYDEMSVQHIIDLTYKLVPSIKNHYMIYYFYPNDKDDFCINDSFSDNEFCFKYKDGVFFIKSSTSTDENSFKINKSIEYLKNIGVSDMHHFAKYFQEAIKQAYYSSLYTKLIGINKAKYSELGAFQLILFNRNNEEFTNFSNRVIELVQDYDITYNSDLLTTLTSYILCNCDLDQASVALDVHKNTIKYRLDRLKDVTDLDYRSFKDLEQLSMSVKIYLSNNF